MIKQLKKILILLKWASLFVFVFLLLADETNTNIINEDSSCPNQEANSCTTYEEKVYTVNFTNVSIIEFIKFVGKISHQNFVFKEEDLDFTVTIISSEPTNVGSIVAALLQTLRINGFFVLEEGNNIIIHQATDVKRIPLVVSDENPLCGEAPPIITRVFKLREADPAVIANLLTPMLSTQALIAVDADSSRLIISDITTNIEQVCNLILSLDVPAFKEFYIYTPKNRDAYALLESIKETVNHLRNSKIADASFLQTLSSAHYIALNDSLIFIGTQEAIQRLQVFLSLIDQQDVGKEQLFIYKVKSGRKSRVESTLQSIISSLHENDPLRETVETMQWIPESQSITFRGSSATLTKLKEFLAVLDTEPATGDKNKTYFIYKLQNIHGEVLLEDLEKLAANLENSGVDNEPLLDALRSAEWVKTTNSIYISGSPDTLTHVKTLISEFDVEKTKDIDATNFHVYKPKNSSAMQVHNALLLIAEDLKAAGLVDPALLNTITKMRYEEDNGSLVFTGTEDSLNKLKDLIDTVDSPLPNGSTIQEMGKTTFFVYRMRYVPAQELITALGAIGDDFARVGGADIALQKTLKNMRYVPSTDSLIFIGSKETLSKIQELIQKFDVPIDSGEDRLPDGYILYRPKHQNGEELLFLLRDFEENLLRSGVREDALFDAIHNAKWMDKTSQILISGQEDAIEKVEKLLAQFDNPYAIDDGKISPETTIETVDDISFLIYKLQFHRGNEIQTALQQIGAEVYRMQTEKRMNHLVETINSIQWLEVTNSLIATGQPKTLAKLKELIRNIDVPLRQVFIELLIIETSLVNSLDFGLRWGTQGKYKDRLGFGMANNPPNDPFSGFTTALGGINSVVTPSGSNIPITQSGFDLGVIGDIILHKGSTYAALGSLVNAVQASGDVNIVLNQKIITQDGRTSTLFVGDNLPFLASQTIINGAAGSTSNNLEYRDIGTSLNITPSLGDGNVITLDIDENITATSSAGSTTELTGIPTSKRSMHTRVHVPDRTFLVLSGQVRNQNVHNRQGIPCLGGIPWIGAFFSQNKSTHTAQNVLIFVKPHIVDTWEDYKKITATQENLARERVCLAGEESLEEVEEGFELVKTPDDE